MSKSLGEIPDESLESIRRIDTLSIARRVLGLDLKRESADRHASRCPLPGHGEQSGQTPPFKIYGPPGGWKCYGCDGAGGDGISLVMQTRGNDFQSACRDIASVFGIPLGATQREPPRPPWEPVEPPKYLALPGLGEPSKVWEVRDVTGRLFAIHARFTEGNGKTFRWWRNGWSIKPYGSTDAPLYGSESLTANVDLVWITEGEKAADALRAIQLTALGTVCGAGSTPCDEVLIPIISRAKRIALWPDADADQSKGEAHMEKLAKAFTRLGAKDVRIFKPSFFFGRPREQFDGEDAFEWCESISQADAVEALTEELERTSVYGKLAGPSLVTGPWKGSEKKPPPEPKPLPVIAAEDVPDGSVPWLMYPIIPDLSVTLLAGREGRGKSLLCLKMAAEFSCSRDFCGNEITDPIRSLIVNGEDPPFITAARLRKLGLAPGSCKIFKTAEGGFELTPRWIELIKRTVDELKIRIIFIDPIVKLAKTGTNFNSSTDVQRLLGPFADLAPQIGCAFVVVAHHSRANDVLGSVAFKSAVRSVLQVYTDPSDPKRSYLTQTKTNYGVIAAPIGFYLEGDPTNPTDHPYVHVTGPNYYVDADTLKDSELDPRDAVSVREAERFVLDRVKPGVRVSVDALATEAGTYSLFFDRAQLRKAIQRLPLFQRMEFDPSSNRDILFIRHKSQMDDPY